MRRILVPTLALLAAVLAPARAAAQDTTGVRLGILYRAQYQPGFVVLPFAGADETARAVREIVRRDLDYADRFELKEPGPGTRPAPVNAALWKERGADWVLSGEVVPRGGGLTLRLALHDAVYGQVRAQQAFDIPGAGDRGFRMGVHAASDAVVRWVTGEPGYAASRVAFVLQGRGSKEIYLVDSDGEGLTRVTTDGSIALSPAWSPDGRHLAYTSFRRDAPFVWERDLSTGADRLVSDRAGLNITPAYSPDGRTIAFATTVGSETELASRDRAGGGVQQWTRGGRFASLSPTFSPDGSRVAFVSDRLGEPQIYVMGRGGGQARILSEYLYGQKGYSTSPDWSPTGSMVAYHTRVGGVHQVVVVDADAGGRPRLLTDRGRNEDPSWAPDGRHLVFASPDRDGGGLFVLDTVSGRVRPLLRGRGYGLPDWSPVLQRFETSARVGG